MIWILVLLAHTFSTGIKVVLVVAALGGFGTLCRSQELLAKLSRPSELLSIATSSMGVYRAREGREGTV